MNEKIYSYFEREYGRINPPKKLKAKLLGREKRKIFTLAAISSSLFIVFILSLIVEFSPAFDQVIMNINFP